ncbi:MAG: response regulator transcription factor [Spirochaetales bacterium]|nr:response regulator transcription factor [Spirochaetales bacterium]
MLKILIADDHPLIRRGLSQILRDNLPVRVLDEVDDGAAVLTALEKEKYDVLILDISLPNRDGMDILIDVKKRYEKLPVLMLSIQPEEQYALRALKLGASGCLNKAVAPENLVEAVKRVAGGSTYINDTVSRLMLENLNRDVGENPHEALSEREFQVLLMIGRGLAVSEISEQLNLSVKTVSTYRTRLLRKMGLANSAQLTSYVYRKGLLEAY